MAWVSGPGAVPAFPLAGCPHRQTATGRTATGLRVTASRVKMAQIKNRLEYNNGETGLMESQGLGWLLLEAGIALGLFVFIVWWTMKK